MPGATQDKVTKPECTENLINKMPNKKPKSKKQNNKQTKPKSKALVNKPKQQGNYRGGYLPLNPTEAQARRCLETFLSVRLDPFIRVRGEVCNPAGDGGYYISLPVYSRLTMAIGTTGVGFCVFNPYRPYNSHNQIWYTSSTYTGADITTAVVTGVSPAPFNSASPATGMKNVKIVGIGAKMFSSSSPLNAKGTVYSITHKENELTATAYSSDIAASPWCASSPHVVGETYMNVFRSQGSINDDKFIATAGGPFNTFCQGFLVTGANPGDTFTVEMRGWMMLQFDSTNQGETNYVTQDPRASYAASVVSNVSAGLQSCTEAAYNAVKGKAWRAATDYIGGVAARTVGQAISSAIRMPQMPIPLGRPTPLPLH